MKWWKVKWSLFRRSYPYLLLMTPKFNSLVKTSPSQDQTHESSPQVLQTSQVTLPFPAPSAIRVVLAKGTTSPEPNPKMSSQTVTVLFLWLSISYIQSCRFCSPCLQQLLHEHELLLLLHSRCLSFSPLYTQCSASQEIAFWNKQDQDWEKMLSMRTRSQAVRCSGPSSFSGSTQKGRYTSKLADR